MDVAQWCYKWIGYGLDGLLASGVRYGAPLSKEPDQSSPAWPIFDWRSLSEWDKTNVSVSGKLICQNGNMQWPAMMIVDRGKIKGTNDPNNGPKWLLLATHELFIRRATKASPSSAGCEPLIWTILNYTQMTTSHRLKGYFEYTLAHEYTRIRKYKLRQKPCIE